MGANCESVDLLIVGGGINGTGIARDAAGRGLKVALVEQSDLGSATSSASTKLIHGGLRYLESLSFRLVRESLLERERMLAMAPHIVQPLAFVLPHSQDGGRGPYSALLCSAKNSRICGTAGPIMGMCPASGIAR